MDKLTVNRLRCLEDVIQQSEEKLLPPCGTPLSDRHSDEVAGGGIVAFASFVGELGMEIEPVLQLPDVVYVLHGRGEDIGDFVGSLEAFLSHGHDERDGRARLLRRWRERSFCPWHHGGGYPELVLIV